MEVLGSLLVFVLKDSWEMYGALVLTMRRHFCSQTVNPPQWHVDGTFTERLQFSERSVDYSSGLVTEKESISY